MFKVNYRNTRARCEICSKLTIKTPKRRHWRLFGVFIAKFEHVSHLCSSVFIVNFEQVNVGWDVNAMHFSQCLDLCSDKNLYLEMFAVQSNTNKFFVNIVFKQFEAVKNILKNPLGILIFK